MKNSFHAPGPPAGILGIKLAQQFSRDPLAFTTEMVREYGPLVHLRFGPQHAFIAAGPEAIHEVLVAGSRTFRKELRTRNAVRKIDGEGIITTEGDFWLRQRRLVQKGFSADRMSHYAEVTARRVEQMLARWPDTGELEICDQMTCLTLETIAETMFEVDMAADSRELAEQVEYLSERLVVELGSPVQVPDWFPLPAKRKKRHALRAFTAWSDGW